MTTQPIEPGDAADLALGIPGPAEPQPADDTTPEPTELDEIGTDPAEEES